MRFALIVAPYYEELVGRLVEGATERLNDAGAEAVDVFEVPGAFEIPFAAQEVALTGDYDGIVCLGAVIRGETSHYDYVCTECARGIQDVGLRTRVPCGFGVLTVDSLDQALARSGGGKRDSGAAAAEAVLALTGVKERTSARS